MSTLSQSASFCVLPSAALTQDWESDLDKNVFLFLSLARLKSGHFPDLIMQPAM